MEKWKCVPSRSMWVSPARPRNHKGSCRCRTLALTQKDLLDTEDASW